MVRLALSAAAFAFALASGSAPVFAAGGGSSSGGSTQTQECAAPLAYDATQRICAPCKAGTKYDAASKSCVVDDAALFDDDFLFEQGRTLALAGHYQKALDVLGSVRNKHDAMVLTMIGYATRKLGRTDEGIAIYHQALAIDPANLNTHEYLGEGYLAVGRVDLAEAQLDAIAQICGSTACEQYRDLQQAILGKPVWN